MSIALESLSAPHLLVAALLIFGVAPGVLLRIISLAYRHDDPRRHEMVAELYAVPRWERPFWVLEQAEVALFEGLWERALWMATGRIIWRWRLESGLELNLRHPGTFWIPDEDERATLQPGDVAKLIFRMKDGWGERMWVTVTERTRDRYVGTLSSTPAGIPKLSYGDRIRFRPHHVIDIEIDEAVSCREDPPQR